MGIDALYYAASMSARVIIIASIFIIAILLIVSYQLKQKYLLYIILIAVPFIVHALVSPDLPVKINEISFAQVLSFSELYKRDGNIVFNNSSHSYFFQAPYLVHALSQICKIPYEKGYNVVLQFGLLFIGIVSICYIYAIESMKKDIPLKAVLPIGAYALICLAFIMDNGGLSGGLSYRLFGTIMVLLSMMFCFQKGYLNSDNQTWTTPLILIILIAGTSLGSPMACIFLILLFGIYSLQTFKAKVFLVLPLAYMIYAGSSYLSALSIYVNNAWNGIILFLQSLTQLQLEERVIPTHRVTTWLPVDSIILSISYLCLLLTATICLLYLGWAIWAYKNEPVRKVRITIFVLMFFLLTITVFTYIGASALREGTSSDVRTIVIQFVAILLPLILMILPFNRTKNAKIFLCVLCFLFIIGAIKDPFRFYPKSINDRINVVEDIRCGKDSCYWAASFLINKVPNNKIIVSDYQVTRTLRRSNSTINPILLTSTQRYFSGDIIAYNKNGLVFPSLYIKPEIYKTVNKQLGKITTIYDDGNTVMAAK